MLQGNNLKTVPNSLSSLGRTLKYLNIAQNPIKELGPDSFKSLSQLTHLTIEQMPELTEIDRETLKPLQSLEVLLCKDNPKLTSFDLDAIGEHKKLRILDVSHCGLRYLTLTSISDTNTNLTDVEKFNHIKVLRLDGNPFHCDCRLFKVLFVLEHHVKDVFFTDNSARCATPYDLVGLILARFDQEAACETKYNDYPIRTQYEVPPFLRARNIILTIISVTVLVLLGTVIGFGAVFIKRKLNKDALGINSEVRYTTVRDSFNDNNANNRFSIT